MKKLIFSGLFLAVIGISVTSCNKEKTNPLNQQTTADSNSDKNNSNGNNGNNGFDGEFNLGNEGRFLVFNSENGYSHAVENPSDQVRANLFNRLNNLNHYSWKDYVDDNPGVNDDVLSDDYFSSILSDEKTVQIGQYIYKINTETEQVLALHVKDKNEYADLVANNTNNDHIRTFSFNENVLDAIKIIGGDPTPQGWFCTESYANARSESKTLTATVSSSLYHTFKTEVKYFAIGIYFHLKSEIIAKTYYNLEGWHVKKFESLVKIDNNRRYKKRCENENPWYAWSVQGTVNDNYAYVSGSYSGSKGLNKYTLLTNFWYSNGTIWVKAYNGPNMYSNAHCGITYNY